MEKSLRVRLLAHSQLSHLFADELENMPLHVTDGKAMALVAIRTCYSPKEPQTIIATEGKKYFKAEATDGEGGSEADRLIRHIMRSGHCYDDKTEVLTDSGFVLFKDLKDSMRVGMVGVDGSFKGFTKEWSYVEYQPHEHEGFIYEHESRDVSFGVTSQHRMFYSPSRYLKKWKIDTMQNIIDSGLKEYRMLRTPRKRVVTERSSKFSNLELELIGFFIGDGHAQSKTRVSFHLKKERKIRYLRNLLLELGIDYDVSLTEKATTKIRFNPKFFEPKDYYDGGQKTLNGLELLEGEEAEHLLRGLINSDGSYTVSNKTEHYCTCSPHLEKEIVTFATINGIATKLDGFGRISLQKEKSHASFIRDSRKPDKTIKKVDYKGNTYCVTVPTGILIVRRNGKVLVCGNTSTIEHISFTFVVTGMSRACLAQLTRHRVGVSFSVQSQRYVKLGTHDASGGFDYTLPETISSEDTEKVKAFIEAMESAQAAYDKLRSIGVAAEDARAVLPQATTCNLVLTMNLRSATDFCKKRLSKQAQAEIRGLAEQIKESIVDVESWTKPFFEETGGK